MMAPSKPNDLKDASAMESSRSRYWDSWKGIAIIAVVVIHSCASFTAFSPLSVNGISGLVLRQVVNFAVPLFFALSGYFATSTFGGDPIKFYRKRLGRIFWPYAVWTTIYLCIRALTDHVSAFSIVKGFMFGTGLGIGYFVIVLAQFIILTPLLASIKTSAGHIAAMLIGTAAGLSFTYSFPALRPEHPLSSFPFYALPFFAWYPFYHLGIYMARFRSQLLVANMGNRTAWAALCVAASVGVVESLYWQAGGSIRFATSQLKASNFIYAALLFVAAIRFERNASLLHRSRTLAWLGNNSFAIYLIHMLFLGPIAAALSNINILFRAQPLFALFCAAVTLCASSALILILRRILSRRAARMILG